jgi:uncharacterized protein YjbI with pentapeptide repeats
MAEKPKKDRHREPPRNLPIDTNASLDLLLEGEPLEDLTFTDLDLSNQRLPALRGSKLLFHRVSFNNCEIVSTRLSDVRFTECDFSNAQLRGFEATRIEFLSRKLVGINALACRWQHVLLDDCDARFGQFSEARIRHSEFSSTQLREAALGRVDFEATSFTDVVPRQADLANTKLAGLDRSTCDLEQITTRIEDLRGAIVSASQAMHLARFLEVVIR